MLVYHQVELKTKEKAWLFAIFAILVYTTVEVPFSFTFGTSLKPYQIWLDLGISLFFGVDFIRYIKREGPHFQKSEGKIKRFFMGMAHALSCFPFELVSFWGGWPSLGFFRLIRLVKLESFFSTLSGFQRGIRIFFIFTGCFLMMHLLTCLWALLHPPLNENLGDYYIKGFYWIVTTLTTVGYGDITPTSNAARIYTMFIMLGGVAFYGLVIGNITRIFTEAAHYREKGRERFGELSAFMKHYQIPKKLQVSVFCYYDHIYSKHLSDNDQKIISDLPQTLKNELQVYMNIKLVKNLPVFEGCSQSCLRAVANALKQEHYGPGKKIIKIGDLGNEMFLIGHGSVDVISKDGQVISQLQEGQFFGEMALLRKTTRSADVKATSYCDLYRLSKERFLRIIKAHPDLYKNIEKITRERLNKKD